MSRRIDGMQDSLRHLSTEHFILRQGQTFSSYADYLGLFGIRANDTLWAQPVPNHANIIVWGPEYNHPQWHNTGNIDSLFPTITEYWEGQDSTMTWLMNRERYFTAQRLRELRLTLCMDSHATPFSRSLEHTECLQPSLIPITLFGNVLWMMLT